MADHRKRPRDPSQLAKMIVDIASGEMGDNKAEAAVGNESARKGGLKGGVARAAKLAPKRRTEIAKKAAKARWAGKAKSSK